MNAPAILTLSPSCKAYISTRIEDRKVRPLKRRGFNLNGDEETLLEINQVKSTIGKMFDFGAYETKIFKYYDRVLLKEEVKTETSPEA